MIIYSADTNNQRVDGSRQALAGDGEDGAGEVGKAIDVGSIEREDDAVVIKSVSALSADLTNRSAESISGDLADKAILAANGGEDPSAATAGTSGGSNSAGGGRRDAASASSGGGGDAGGSSGGAAAARAGGGSIVVDEVVEEVDHDQTSIGTRRIGVSTSFKEEEIIEERNKIRSAGAAARPSVAHTSDGDVSNEGLASLGASISVSSVSTSAWDLAIGGVGGRISDVSIRSSRSCTKISVHSLLTRMIYHTQDVVQGLGVGGDDLLAIDWGNSVVSSAVDNKDCLGLGVLALCLVGNFALSVGVWAAAAHGCEGGDHACGCLVPFIINIDVIYGCFRRRYSKPAPTAAPRKTSG